MNSMFGKSLEKWLLLEPGFSNIKNIFAVRDNVLNFCMQTKHIITTHLADFISKYK
jgi:hypothetical protein